MAPAASRASGSKLPRLSIAPCSGIHKKQAEVRMSRAAELRIAARSNKTDNENTSKNNHRMSIFVGIANSMKVSGIPPSGRSVADGDRRLTLSRRSIFPPSALSSSSSDEETAAKTAHKEQPTVKFEIDRTSKQSILSNRGVAAIEEDTGQGDGRRRKSIYQRNANPVRMGDATRRLLRAAITHIINDGNPSVGESAKPKTPGRQSMYFRQPKCLYPGTPTPAKKFAGMTSRIVTVPLAQSTPFGDISSSASRMDISKDVAGPSNAFDDVKLLPAKLSSRGGQQNIKQDGPSDSLVPFSPAKGPSPHKNRRLQTTKSATQASTLVRRKTNDFLELYAKMSRDDLGHRMDELPKEMKAVRLLLERPDQSPKVAAKSERPIMSSVGNGLETIPETKERESSSPNGSGGSGQVGTENLSKHNNDVVDVSVGSLCADEKPFGMKLRPRNNLSKPRKLQ